MRKLQFRKSDGGILEIPGKVVEKLRDIASDSSFVDNHLSYTCRLAFSRMVMGSHILPGIRACWQTHSVKLIIPSEYDFKNWRGSANFENKKKEDSYFIVADDPGNIRIWECLQDGSSIGEIPRIPRKPKDLTDAVKRILA